MWTQRPFQWALDQVCTSSGCWDRMGWDRVGWDGMGQDGTGQDRMRQGRTSRTSCLRCHTYACIHLWTMWTNCPRPAPIAPNWPTQDRMGWDRTGQDGTSGTSCLRCHIYACIHWWTMWTNCPRPAPIATNWPQQGRWWSSPSCHLPKIFFGTTTKCSSLKWLRTTSFISFALHIQDPASAHLHSTFRSMLSSLALNLQQSVTGNLH